VPCRFGTNERPIASLSVEIGGAQVSAPYNADERRWIREQALPQRCVALRAAAGTSRAKL